MASLIERHKGTRFVPKTGPAVLQRGEAVIPKKANPFGKGGKKKKKAKKGGIAAMLATKFKKGAPMRPDSDSDYA